MSRARRENLLARDLPDEFRSLAERAIEQGWRISRGGKGHFKWKSPDGVGMVVTASTASDHRAVDNTRSKLRKYRFVE